jgi:hypothetical protein
MTSPEWSSFSVAPGRVQRTVRVQLQRRKIEKWIHAFYSYIICPVRALSL